MISHCIFYLLSIIISNSKYIFIFVEHLSAFFGKMSIQVLYSFLKSGCPFFVIDVYGFLMCFAY